MKAKKTIVCCLIAGRLPCLVIAFTLLLSNCGPLVNLDHFFDRGQGIGGDNNGTSSGSGTGEAAIGMEMVRINAGSFQMGCGDSSTPSAFAEHMVTLTQGFYMGATEVTQLQWRQVMTGNTNSISYNPSWFSATGSGSGQVTGLNTDNFPVERVSWYEILVFANRLSIARGLTPAYSIDGSINPDDWGAVPTTTDATWNAVQIVPGSTGYRLPTEAQWEYAARAGTTYQWSFGDNSADAGEYMWFSQNSQSRTQEVGTRQANPWGLYDMHGNVWEWVWDWWGEWPYSGDERTDPTGAVSGNGRVLRGGGWNFDAVGARSASRGRSSPGDGWDCDGFRLVRP